MLIADLLNVNCSGGGGGGGEVNNNSHVTTQQQHVVTASTSGKGVRSEAQPAVGVAAVAACKVCQPQFLHPQQRTQQPWPGVTAQAVATGNSSRHRYTSHCSITRTVHGGGGGGHVPSG